MKVRLAIWAAFVVACLVVVSGTRFTADMSAFLPTSPTAAQQLLVDQLRHGPVARLLLIAIAGEPDTSVQRADLSRQLTLKLRAEPGFESVNNGVWNIGAKEQGLLFEYRYLLSDAVEAGRFSIDGLHGAIESSLQTLASPMGLAFKDLLVRDPGGELLRMLDRLEPTESPAFVEGVWSSADARRALILVQLRDEGTELDAQEAALNAVRRHFDEAGGSQNKAVRLEISGTARFAVESRARIRADVQRLSIVGSVLILLLLGSVYRSPRLLLLGVVPVATGALASICAVSFAFGQVHGITLGFGIALIGEAIDYAIYVFIQGNHARLWRTIRLGVLTSLIGFSTLLFSDFPGLAQLGLFAITGILTAFLVTWGLLGPMFLTAPVAVSPGLSRRLAATLGGLRRLRALPIVAVVLALATTFVLAQRQPLWESNLGAISPVGDVSKALDATLRSDLKAPDLRYVVAVTAADADQALVGAGRAGELLQPLVDSGVLSGFDSPAKLLPDADTQRQRRDRLPDATSLRATVLAATANTPLKAERLAPFIADVERSRRLEPLGVADVAGTAIGIGVDAMMVTAPGRSTAILPLRARDDGPAALTIDAAAVRRALSAYRQPGAVQLVDIKAESEALYTQYLSEARWLAALGMALIVLVLAVAHPRRLARIILPIGAALSCVIAGLAAAGIGLTILHLVGLLLTVAVGSNYTLFFVDNDDDDPRLLASLALANATTTIGFGVLAFASVPVLNAIGMTVGPGALLCLAFAAMLSARSTTQ